MSSKSRRVAALAVATTLATASATAPVASAASRIGAEPSAQSAVAAEPAAVKPPASVTGLARDLGISTDVAWRTLDDPARSGASRARAAAPTKPSRPRVDASGMSQPSPGRRSA